MIKFIKKHKKQIFCISFCVLFAFFLCLLSPINPFSQKLWGTDTWVFQYNALAMQKGLLPYIDFFDHKGILLYFINLLGLMINKNFGIWIIEVIFMFFSIFFAKKTLDLFDKNEVRKYFVLILVMLFLSTTFEGGNLTEEYFLPFAMLSQYVFCKYLLSGKVKNYEVLLTGVSFAIVCFLRINMIGLWGAYLLVILIKFLKEKEFKKLFGYIGWFLLGILIVVLPLILYMLINNVFFAFINSYFIFNFKYSNVSIFERYESFKFFGRILIILLALIVNILLIFNKNKINRNILITNLLSFIITLIGIIMSGNLYMHYAVMIIPCLLIPYLSLLIYSEKNEIAKLAILTYLSIYILVPSIFSYFDFCKKIRIYDNSPNVEIASYIKNNTNSSDKISIYGNKNILYVLSERYSVSKYSYQVPLIEYDHNIFDSYINDILTYKPKIIYMASESAELENILLLNGYSETIQNMYVLN